MPIVIFISTTSMVSFFIYLNKACCRYSLLIVIVMAKKEAKTDLWVYELLKEAKISLDAQ